MYIVKNANIHKCHFKAHNYIVQEFLLARPRSRWWKGNSKFIGVALATSTVSLAVATIFMCFQNYLGCRQPDQPELLTLQLYSHHHNGIALCYSYYICIMRVYIYNYSDGQCFFMHCQIGGVLLFMYWQGEAIDIMSAVLMVEKCLLPLICGNMYKSLYQIHASDIQVR